MATVEKEARASMELDLHMRVGSRWVGPADRDTFSGLVRPDRITAVTARRPDQVAEILSLVPKGTR